MLLLGGAYFGLKLIRYSLLFWLPFYLHQHCHYTEGQAGYLSLPFEVGGIVGSVAVGWISDVYFRTQRLRAAAMAVFLLGGALFAYQLYGGAGLLVNALLLGVVGFMLFGPDSLLSGTVAQELGGQHATGRVAGVINGMGSVGAIFSPLLVAWMSERYGWSMLFYGFVAITVLAGVLVTSAQALDRIPREQRMGDGDVHRGGTRGAQQPGCLRQGLAGAGHIVHQHHRKARQRHLGQFDVHGVIAMAPLGADRVRETVALGGL